MKVGARLRRLLLRWLDLAPLPVSETSNGPRKISPAALEETKRAGRVLDAFLPAVAPPWIADEAKVALDQATQGFVSTRNFAEGLGFLGFPYLSELTQRPEYRHVAGIWAAEATRKWIKIKGPDDKVAKLTERLKDLDIRGKFRELIEHDGFFGRAHLFVDMGHSTTSRELSKPLLLNPGKIGKGKLKGFKVIEPMWCYPGPYNSSSPLHPDYYRPVSWYVMSNEVHNSRLLTFAGRDLPDLLKPSYVFAGLSLSQMIKPYVDNWLDARQSVANMLRSFSTMVLGTDMDAVLQGGSAASLVERAALFTNNRDNQGLMIVDNDSETLTNVSAPLSSLDKLQAQAQEHIASVSGIPLVVLLGVTPSGLNASSDGEMRAFYDKVMAMLERCVRAPLTTVLSIIQLDEYGAIDPSVTFEFEPLYELSEAERATVRKTDADTDSVYIASGVVSPDEVRERVAADPATHWHESNLTGAAPEKDDDAEQLDALTDGNN